MNTTNKWAMPPEEYISALYKFVLHRAAEPEAIAYWSNVMRSSGDPTAVLAQVLASDEYRQHRDERDMWAMSPGEYITAIYEFVLRRSAEPEAIAHWSNIMRCSRDPTAVMAQVLASDEYRRRRRRLADAPRFDLIVPVCNAARWLGPICEAYKELGLQPLFILDARSTDDSLNILVAHDARIMRVHSEHPRVESLLYAVVPQLSSPWLLRFDDDELPSPGLIRWITANLETLETSVVGFPRQWVARLPSSGAWMMTRCCRAGGDWGSDRQYRLFRPRAVEPTDEVHTRGFHATGTIEAPEDAAIFHFDWLVRSYDERLRKIEVYEQQKKGRGMRFRDYYLPEDHDTSFYEFVPLNDSLIQQVSERLVQSVSETC
jgi:hypothetical protein